VLFRSLRDDTDASVIAAALKLPFTGAESATLPAGQTPTVTPDGAAVGAIRLYKFSISYLTVLFAAVAVDALVLIRIA
jgi:heme O synthase-like polyprenyltransferase